MSIFDQLHQKNVSHEQEQTMINQSPIFQNIPNIVQQQNKIIIPVDSHFENQSDSYVKNQSDSYVKNQSDSYVKNQSEQPKVFEHPQQIKQNIEKITQKIEVLQETMNTNNIKQTVLTNQQKSDFQNYANQLYQTLDQTIQNIPPINMINSIILSLEAISEKCISGKKQGAMRQDLVYNESINYLKNRNVVLDDNSKILIRGLIEQTFISNENRLKKIFNDLFDVSQSCLSICSQGPNSILQNIIPIQK